MAENKPFYSSVASTVTGGTKGLVTGALVGGGTWGALGAVGGAIAGATSVLLTGDTTLSTVMTEAGSAAVVGGTVGLGGGAVVGGITGEFSGAITGWVNSRRGGNELAQEQEKAQAYAQGMVQGATLAKLDEVERVANSASQQQSWVQRVGGKHHQPELHADRVQQQQASTQPGMFNHH